jgi:cell division septal protein FtsQ
MTRQEHMKISSVLHCSREALPHTILLNVQERDREAYAQDHFFGVITNSIGLAIQYI